MNSSTGKNKGQENKQSLWTKETIGVILVLFATLCMVCLITRDAVFSHPGKWVNSFLFGCFGFFSYFVLIFLGYVGVTMVSGKNFGFSLKRKMLLTTTFVLIAVLAQVISLSEYSSIGYGEYLSTAYSMGEGGIQTTTSSGAFTSVISYVFPKLLTNVGSYVVLGITIVISLFFTLAEFFGTQTNRTKKSTPKVAPSKFRGSFVRANSTPVAVVNQEENSVQTNTAVQNNGKPRLFVSDPDSFSVRSKREVAKDKNAYDMLMGYSDNGLGVAYTPPAPPKEPKQVSYTDTFKDKIDYVMTPSVINVENLKSNSYSLPSAPYYNREEVKGTTISDYVKPRTTETVVPPVSTIPHTEHEGMSSFSSDSAENNAQRFSRYAETIDFGGGRINTREATNDFSQFGRGNGLSSTQTPTPTPTPIPFVEEEGETTIEEEKPKVQTFEPNTLDGPEQSILGSRRVRNIFTEDNEKEKAERPPVVEEEDDKTVTPPPITPSFTSRVSADNNFGARRAIFDEKPVVETTSTVTPTPSSTTEEEKPKKVTPPINRRYHKPPLDLLETRATAPGALTDNHAERMEIIQKTLEEFHINAIPQSYVQGPSITRYEIMMPAGISVKKVLNYDDDLKMRLAVRDGVRIEAPIPGKNLVGIEVANSKKTMVGLKEVMEGLSNKKVKESALMFALGKDIVGNSISDDLTKGPHYLIAGATGSGKSVALHVMIVSLLMRYSPEELKLVLVDPKSVEFRKYEHIPHLLVDEIVTEPKRALALLQWAYDETNRRNEMFTECGGMISNIEDYNTHIAGPTVAKLPRIVFIIDELADLMEACKKDLEARIRMIAAKSRSAGIHLVLATQRPSVDVITGTIKANLPSRIALKVMNYPDSQTILGEGGAEKLLGNGDMLYKNSSMADYERYQGAFISGREISNIVDYIKENNKAYFDDEVQSFLDNETRAKQEETSGEEIGGDNNANEVSELFLQALWLAVTSQSASISQFQRRFGIGYARAGGLIDKMERMGFVSGNEGSKARRVLLTKEEYESRFGTPPETF